jgi:hypothetical protein
MNIVQLRLWTFKKGLEVSNLWAFTPLDDRDGLLYGRESNAGVGGRLRRRPFREQIYHKLTVGAGTLRVPEHMTSFKRLLRSHKVEWNQPINGKDNWVEFSLDVDPDIVFDVLEDISSLRRYTFKLVLAEPLGFDKFEA